MASFLLLSATVMAKEVKTVSPNGKLVVTINDNGGLATYSITLNGQLVLLPSRLGFKADFGDFTQGLSITKSSEGFGDGDYPMRQVKQSHISYKCSTLLVTFHNSRNQEMQVDFFVKDNKLMIGYSIIYPNVMFSTSMSSWRKIWADSLNLSGFSVVR